MPDLDTTKLQKAVRRKWSKEPGPKAQQYVGRFSDTIGVGNKIAAKVTGNHGIYTVSVEIKDNELVSACSCYIGKGGYCHHCQALALTYLQNPAGFKEVEIKQREDVKHVSDLQAYLQSVTLESLLKRLSKQGITQKSFAESIGMNPRHLSMIKSSEARHHYYNELGATKLACVWVLEQVAKGNGQ
jgi:hypothetical protein